MPMDDDAAERRRVTREIVRRDYELAVFLAMEFERGLLEGDGEDAAADRAIRAVRADPALNRRLLRALESAEQEG